ncbi:TPA: type II secretion system F family protein [Vibrio cholerae]|uniref:type II secretion system F family protein n=1 Tax=Vibrio cholerae TaxID=666 RepID=UPI002FDBA492
MMLLNFESWLLIAIVSFVGLLLVGMLLWRDQQMQTQWLAQSLRYRQLHLTDTMTENGTRHWLAVLGGYYPTSDTEKKCLTQMLEQAGIYSKDALDKVRGAKLLLGLLTAMLALGWQWSKGELFTAMTLTMALVGYVLGSNLPEYGLRRQSKQAKQRQQQIVADAMDLMVISIEAGLSLDRALERVGHYLLDVEPMLAKQFLRTHAEIQVLGDTALCMKKLAWRTGLQELERCAATLAMAQRYGSPLAETMRNISQDARQMRKMALQEQAGKLPGRITLIQMAFIMLPLLVLIIAPTLNVLLESLR